ILAQVGLYSKAELQARRPVSMPFDAFPNTRPKLGGREGRTGSHLRDRRQANVFTLGFRRSREVEERCNQCRPLLPNGPTQEVIAQLPQVTLIRLRWQRLVVTLH